MSLQVRRHLLDYQYADVETAKAAEDEEKKRQEEEKKKREEEEKRRREEEQRRREEEERRRREEERRQEERQQQIEQKADGQRREERRQPQSLEEEAALVRQRLEEQRRRQEEERRRQEEERRRLEEERRRHEEEERRRREEEEKRRREEERLRREEEERRRREEEMRRQEEQRLRTQPQSLEEETELIRRHLEEQRRRQQEEERRRQEEERRRLEEERHRQEGRHEEHREGQDKPPLGAPEGGGEKERRDREDDKKQIGFDDVVEMLRREGDPRKVVEKLREVGYEVEEVVDRSGLVQGADYHYGWIVKAGGRYIAITSGHKIGRGDVGDYVVMELPDKGLARNFLVGRYWGTAWGDPDFVRRAAEAAHYERELDRWMREELGRAGYRAERIDWGPGAATPGFTYVIRDSEGRKIGEVQVAKVGNRFHLINTGLPPAVMATGDPKVAALYFVYKHETGDENIAWRLATGDERAKELFESKLRYEQELKVREGWFKELTQRGFKPIAYSKIDGRAVVSEGDLFLDEKTGVTYRVVLERQDDRITMKLVPASERDERLLALKSLETEGFRVIDDRTVERDGIRYAVRVEERDGKKFLRLEPYPEDAKKAAEREVWWELWKQGFAKRGDYAVKDGVKYSVEVVEQDGKYVAKLTPVGPASPEEEPRRYRRGDWRGTLGGMRQIQFTIEKLGLEGVYRPEELAEGLRFGGKRPRDVPYIPVLDEVAYGAFGVPLSQAMFHPAGRELYQRYATATLPGPRIEGFTLPERQALERVAEVQRLYAERFADVWTPLTLRAPTTEDVNWRTAVATATETFTFWIPVAKGAAALAAARGLRIPGLTAERTVATGYGIRSPRVPGDYFEIHYVEPRKVAETVKGALVAEGVGEGVAVRGGPGHWEFALARSAGKPEPGWAFEFATVTYRDVAEWLRRIPSIGIRTELRPRVLRFTEVRGFARDLPEPPRLEPPRFEPKPRGREVKVEWREPPKPPARESPRAEPETPRPATKVVERAVAKVAQVEEELVRPVRVELPVAQPVRTATKVAEEVGEVQRVSGETTAVAPVGLSAPAKRPLATERLVEGRAVEWPVEVPTRELGYVYIPMWSRDFAVPLTYPFEVRAAEMPAVYAAYETERKTARPDVLIAETSSRSVRTAGTQRTADAFPAPPPPAPPRLVRGGYGGGVGSAYMAHRPPRVVRRGWRVYELLRI